MLTDARLKQIMYVGQRRGELHREAVRQAHAEGELQGRKEERERIRTRVQALRDEWLRGYGYCGIDLDINVKKAFHEVLTLVEETTNE